MEQIKIIELTAIPRTHTHTHTNESVHLPKKKKKPMWMLKTISNTIRQIHQSLQFLNF